MQESEVEVIRVTTLDEISSAVRAIFRDTKRRWWFRGHTDAQWRLQPKVWRGYDAQMERNLTNHFYQGAKLRHASFPDDSDYASWLGLMQHYGLPTRLLDWSEAALTAAYFAVKHNWDLSKTPLENDAAIWMLDPIGLNEQHGSGPWFPSLNAKTLDRLVYAAFVEPDEERSRDIATYKVHAAVPVNQDLRMLMQQSTFTVHSDSDALETFSGSSNWLRKLVIPSEARGDLRESLDVLGLRLSDVFPDLNHLAIQLMNMHRPQ